MSNVGELYFKLQEQAEYYGLDLDFETLEFIPRKPEVKRNWRDAYMDKLANGDFNVEMDIDRE